MGEHTLQSQWQTAGAKIEYGEGRKAVGQESRALRSDLERSILHLVVASEACCLVVSFAALFYGLDVKWAGRRGGAFLQRWCRPCCFVGWVC